MALRAVPTPDESSLTVNVYDGTRQAFPAGTKCSLPRLRRQSEPAGVAGETSVFARLHPPVLRQLRGQLQSDRLRRQVSSSGLRAVEALTPGPCQPGSDADP